VNGQQHAPAALYPREKPGTHFTGGWVGTRAGLAVFNMYLDEIINKWQKEDVKGISLSKCHQLLRPLFADEQVIISNTQNNLQKSE